jgi:heptose I phosphotransferase
MSGQRFVEISESFFIDADYEHAFNELALRSIEAIFAFDGGSNLSKSGLPRHRSRLRFETNSPKAAMFLKRYDRPPILVQLKNWLSAGRRVSTCSLDVTAAQNLSAAGINTPKTIVYGDEWGTFFEKRSFIITESIPSAESLEKELPDCFYGPPTAEKLKLRRDFITRLATFVRTFHGTGYRHRDLYLCHIFYTNSGQFYLIDLARAFKPKLFSERFRIKDIAQLFYSAPGRYFSTTDRLRFYLRLGDKRKLDPADKVFILKVINKAKRMAKHDVKRGRYAPFAS